MSQPFKIAYGISLPKKTGPPKPKPGGPPKRKPVFGGGDDDGNSDDGNDAGGVFARGPKSVAALKKKKKKEDKAAAAEPVVEAITELDDDLLMGTVASVNKHNDDDHRKKAQRKGAPSLAQPPPSKYKDQQQPADGGGDLASAFSARKQVEAAEALDPSIYDYDASYDAFKAAAKKIAPGKGDATADDDTRNSQYMSNLRKMAEVRERDRRIAEDRKMQRAREAEGDAFAGKEQFVTEAYKKQQEENRQLEEAERRREEAEAAAGGGGMMTGFYKGLLARDEQRQAAIQQALAEGGGGEKQAEKQVEEEEDPADAEARAREINARGGNVVVNDDGEVVDKRQLLKGGLNVSARKKTEMERAQERREQREREQREREQHERRDRGGDNGRHSRAGGSSSRQAMRDRQSQMLEEQYAQSLKRAREEEEEKARALELAAKSRKTAADISSAKERYLARKRAEAEAAAKKG